MIKYLKIIGFSLILVISCEDATDDLADAITGGAMYTDSDVIGVYDGTSSYMYANGDCSGDIGTDLMGFHEDSRLIFNAGTMGFSATCEDAEGNVTFVEDGAQCDGEYDESVDIATWELVNDVISITLLNPVNNDFPISTFNVTDTGLECDFAIPANCSCEDEDCPDTQAECEALGDAAEWREAVCAKVTLTKQ